MKESQWTAKMVELRLEEAADTLSRLPSVIPQARLCSWPEIIRDYWEIYGNKEAEQRISSASPKAVREMDEALLWFKWLDAKESKIVWLRACRVRWRALEKRFRLSRQTLWQQWSEAIDKMTAQLNQKTAH